MPVDCEICELLFCFCFSLRIWTGFTGTWILKNQKTDKKADFTEVHTLADDEVIRCLLISSTLNRSISVYLFFSYDYAKSCQNCLFSYDSIWKLLPNQLLIIVKLIAFKSLFPFNMLDSTETVQFTAAAYFTWLHYWNITYYFKHEDTEKN